MKKLTAILLAAMLILCMAACGKSEPAVTKTGLGMAISMSSANAEDGDNGKAEADVTSCAATFDAEGKILAISFDVAQCKVTVSPEGAVTVPDSVKTKRELGDDYNMLKYGGAVGEWYEQAAALEAYCIGKTAAEVCAMPLQANSKGMQDTPAVEELTSTCTIGVTDFLKALESAYTNAK